jgi:hypothetical protein
VLYLAANQLKGKSAPATKGKIVDDHKSELIWDYQGNWTENDIKGPLPFGGYKMKKNFDFVLPSSSRPTTSNGDWGIIFGYSKGFVAPITRNEEFRFRCVCSNNDANYANSKK